jgi:hypothetical protein
VNVAVIRLQSTELYLGQQDPHMNNSSTTIVTIVLTLGILGIASGIFGLFGNPSNDAMIVAGSILLAGGAISANLCKPPSQ